MDSLIAVLLFIGTAVYLVQRNTPQLMVWLVLTYLVVYNCFVSSRTLAVLLGIGAMFGVCYLSTREGFEEEKKLEEKENNTPEPTGKAAHVDLGTTILHAYRNLTPEQIGGMKRDTKELMELQKELMGTLAEMKPAIEQGAELLGTFSQFFGQQ
jgi:hypothetical protein